jgi:hypothetical protein
MDAAEERGLLLQEDGYHELLLLPSLVFLLKFASPFFPEMKLDILFLFFLGRDGAFGSIAQLASLCLGCAFGSLLLLPSPLDWYC